MNFSYLLFSVLGWLILRFKYKTKDKRIQVLNNEYDGLYATVGAEYPLKIFGVILILLLLGFLGAVIYSIFKHGPAPV